ncbi:MAG: hypothetical protein WC729_09965 [Sphingomonas sp.]|uniref:hypothetical protein n=1 Tax=Sphingomonas sp. TaxID=28214 RepID=UPI003564003C
MKPISPIVSAVLGGVTGGVVAFVVAIIISRPSVWAGFTGISGGEWLQALAAVVGVFLTIQGTLWLEERKRKRDRMEEQRLLKSALITFRNMATAIVAPDAEDASLQQRALKTAAHFEILRNAYGSLEYARQSYRITDIKLFMALDTLKQDYEAARVKLGSEESLARGRHVTEPALAICRSELKDFVDEMQLPTNEAIDALEKLKL